MRIVVAPDSYKGSVSALQVAEAMARGIRRIFPHSEVVRVPVADGGEGTVEAMICAAGGQLRHTEVTAPLGDRVLAHWGVLGDGRTAVIEMAAASGLTLVPRDRLDPRISTSFGTGELIRAALDAGLRRIILGIGGSATNDGGVGMAQALGVSFLDSKGTPLAAGGAALAGLAQIDLGKLDSRLGETELIVACDVDNPLSGPRGASAVFGPQKGASATVVQELDAALSHFAQIARQATGRDVALAAGAGAAGGLGAGLLFFTPAQLRPGVEIVLEAANFAERLQGARFVLTGEGRTDFQTACGKAPVGVARHAKAAGLPVFCLSGGIGQGADEVLQHGIDAVLSICDRPMTLEESMRDGEALIEAATARLCRILTAAG